MKLQILLHSKDADSFAGYERTRDISQALNSNKVLDLDGLKSILKEAGSVSTPCSILYCGHSADDLKFHNENHSRHGTILAIPKDPVVRVMLPTQKKVWMSSIGQYEGCVKDLKALLKDPARLSPARMLLVNVFGKIFGDGDILRSSGFFEDQNATICMQQLDGYTVTAASERLSSTLKEALQTQQRWCSIGDLSEECKQASDFLFSNFSSGVGDLKPYISSDPGLLPFTFNRFEQDFPPRNIAPEPRSCKTLDSVKGQFLLQTTNSQCPLLAQQIIEALIVKLSNTNIVLAEAAAKSLGPLVQPVNNLSSKDNLLHDHRSYHDKLETIRQALQNYRDIMAWKMYSEPSENEKREESIKSLQEAMSCISELFSDLVSEWAAAQRWSDLSCFTNVEKDVLIPAMRAVDELVGNAARLLETEEGRLRSLKQVEMDAKHIDSLMQNQVRWCSEVAEASITAVESDIEDIDRKIRSLLKLRAERSVLKSCLEQRVDSLKSLLASQTQNFEAFQEGYKEEEAVTMERVKQAMTGKEAAEAFKKGMAELTTRINAEIEALRSAAEELQMDVGADCVLAYKLGGNVDCILSHYKEVQLKTLEEKREKKTKEYRKAATQGRKELAQELTVSVEDLKLQIAGCGQTLQQLRDHTAEIEKAAAGPWDFLCARAVGGAAGRGTARGRGTGREVERGPVRICVRTSVANREAWGGEDRVLERPEEWNREMRAEADEVLGGLLESCRGFCRRLCGLSSRVVCDGDS